MAAKPKKKKNGTRYNQDAIELARSLYCKYGGKNLDAVQREMRKAGYPGWLKTYLFDKGRDGTAHYRMGWITKYGFDNSLRMHLEKLVESVNDDEQDLYVGIKATRKELQKKITGKAATKTSFISTAIFASSRSKPGRIWISAATTSKRSSAATKN
jgi:hypothetical protein